MTSKHTILYVEDDLALLDLSTNFLERTGYRVVAARNGMEAWKILRSKHFDLLITDYELPLLNGLDLVAKTRIEGLDIPVIVTSGYAIDLDKPSHEWLQIAAWLQKPFTLDTLADAAKRILAGPPTRTRLKLSALFFSDQIPPFSSPHGGLNE